MEKYRHIRSGKIVTQSDLDSMSANASMQYEPIEEDNHYCPECGIGLNNREISLNFCQNCKANWE